METDLLILEILDKIEEAKDRGEDRILVEIDTLQKPKVWKILVNELGFKLLAYNYDYSQLLIYE